jgi:amidase
MTDPDVSTADVGFTSAFDLVEGRRAGDFTSVELVSTLLHRIQTIDDCDGGVQSVLAISTDLMDQAVSCDSREATGQLHGIPVLVKDNIQAIGLPGTAGSLALAGRTVVEDAELVSRLRAAGAIVMGSTNLSEWANIRSGKSTSGFSPTVFIYLSAPGISTRLWAQYAQCPLPCFIRFQVGCTMWLQTKHLHFQGTLAL